MVRNGAILRPSEKSPLKGVLNAADPRRMIMHVFDHLLCYHIVDKQSSITISSIQQISILIEFHACDAIFAIECLASQLNPSDSVVLVGVTLAFETHA